MRPSAGRAKLTTTRLPLPAGRTPTTPRLPPPPSALADDDDEIIPLLAPRRQAFTPKELEALSHPKHTLGGKTVGEELSLIRAQYLAAEAKASQAEAHLHSAAKGGNWDGDVYVGSAWNEATVLGLIAAAVPLAGLVFAVATKGTLWGLVDYYGM
jgi:hypothetical protein